MSYTFFITAFIYPTVAHWVWGGGFLSGIGFIDFAGSGVVHMVGGVAGLMGAFWVGPRIGRFEGKIFHVTVNDDDFQPSSHLNCALGVFILWFGWYGFNPGSTVAIYGDANGVAALAAINTTLSACFAAITCFVVSLLLAKMNPSRTKVDVGLLMNSILAGLVGITGGCSVVTPVSAIIIGIISGVWYMAASHFLKQLKIDDPLDAAPIHLFCGFWGVLAIGIFVDPAAAEAAGFEALPDGEQFGVQFAGGGLIMLWSLLCSTFVFIPLKCLGLLRVDEATELQGLDLVEHKRRRIFGNGIYDHPVLRETFFAFLEEQLVPEHALFVRAVERYKMLFQRELTPDVKDAIRCSAEEIMRTFINDDAQYLVNISHDIMTNVKKQASNSEFTEGLWDPVWKVLRRTVLEMMPAFNISTHARMAETILNWIHNAERYSPELMKSVGHHFSGERNLDVEFNL
jgi:ammonium transporter